MQNMMPKLWYRQKLFWSSTRMEMCFPMLYTGHGIDASKVWRVCSLPGETTKSNSLFCYCNWKFIAIIRRTYKFRSKIKLVIPCCPNPRLIRNTSLDKPSPWIPPSIIVVGVVICVRQISNEQYGLSFWRVVLIMRKGLIWIKALPKIPCSSIKWKIFDFLKEEKHK